MSAHSSFFRFLGLGIAVQSAFAVSVPLDGLISESPFVLKQADNAPAAVTEGATVEFRGMFSTKEGVFFGFYDRAKNTGAWVRQDDKNSDFNVSSYDASGELVTVEYKGQRFTLPLSSSKIGAAAPSPLPVVNATSNNGTPMSAVQPGARGDDQRRLESVAAEVRRRRALRQAAAVATPAPVEPPAVRQ